MTIEILQGIIYLLPLPIALIWLVQRSLGWAGVIFVTGFVILLTVMVSFFCYGLYILDNALPN